MQKLTESNYTKDKLHGPVTRTITEVLKRTDHVAPVEVLMQMEPANIDGTRNTSCGNSTYGEWRFRDGQLYLVGIDN